MDDKQADRVRVYGFIHEFLRLGNVEVARIIEAPDVTMQTSLTPSGTLYQGGPFLIEQKYSSQFNGFMASNPTFSRVTITRLTSSFTSNNIFFVRQPTRILLIKGVFGEMWATLNEMGINYTLVQPDVVLNNPSLLNKYSLIVVDCPGWFGNPDTFSPTRRSQIQAVYDTIRSHIQAGNEVIFNDIALKDLNATFPGYVNLLGPNPGGTWSTSFHNPPNPSSAFSPEFPSQYYNVGPDPNTISIPTYGSGWTVARVQAAHVQDVRIVMDSRKFGIPYQYAILGFYFQFGSGIVEGLTYDRDQGTLPLDTKSFYAVEQIYGNKFVEGLQTDFTLSASPATETINQGSTANYTVTVTSVGGFSAPVNLQVSGLPASSTPSFTPVAVTPAPSGSVSSTLRISTSFSTPNGTFPLTITGTSTLPAITRSTNVVLVVNLAKPDFVLDANPKLLIVNQTKCGNITTSVKALGTFNSPVNLTLSGLPAYVTYKYTPNPVTPPIGGTSSSTLTLCPAADSTPGNYTLTITGTSVSPAIVHTVNVTLRIPKPTGSNPLIYLIVLLLLLLALALALLAIFLSRKRPPRAARYVIAPMKRLRARPRFVHVLPIPTVHCRYCGRIMPLYSVYCPYCGRPQVILARPPKVVQSRMPRTSRKGILAFVLSLVAGILVTLNGVALLSPGFWGLWSGIFFWLPTIGPSYAFALGVLIGLVLVMGSLVVIMGHGTLADVIIFPFAVFSLFIGGGFVAGMVLGIVGGITGALKR
jgi:hypothetical protein